MKKIWKKIFRTKEMREYEKMAKKHRNELVSFDKESADFDYSYLHRYVVLKLKHMYEFYLAGNNVWQCDEKRDLVLKTLKHAIDIADEIDNVWSDKEICIYVEGDREEGLYKEFYSYIGENIMWWWD